MAGLCSCQCSFLFDQKRAPPSRFLSLEGQEVAKISQCLALSHCSSHLRGKCPDSCLKNSILILVPVIALLTGKERRVVQDNHLRRFSLVKWES